MKETEGYDASMEPSFKVHDKKINWVGIYARHDKVSRNRQSVMQQRMNKWQIYFSIWGRKRLIAEMKKKLVNENGTTRFVNDV